jgi:hypothetical protein
MFLHHVLGVIKISVLTKSCSVPNTVVARKKRFGHSYSQSWVAPFQANLGLVVFTNQHLDLASFHLVSFWSSSILENQKCVEEPFIVAGNFGEIYGVLDF